MTLRELSALVTTIIILVGTTWYIFAALKGTKVKPVLPSWIVMSGTMTLSFATYWTSPKHSLISNAINAVSVLSTGAILIVAIYLHFRNGDSVRFSRFQKWCLWISAFIAAFWIIAVWGLKGTGIVPNILTQILMLIGYLVTIQKIWGAPKNTESLFTWWCLVIASIIGLYTGIVSHDGLAILYAARATLASATLVWIMHRIERKSQFATVI